MGLIRWIASIPLVLIGLLVLVVIFFEARKVYWDHIVKEMCEKDGGIQILGQVAVTGSDIEMLGHIGEEIAVPVKELASKDAPVYSESTTTYIRDSYPKIRHSDVEIIRREDEKTIARYSRYARIGGDFPTGIVQPSSFSCPDSEVIISEINKIFIVEEELK